MKTPLEQAITRVGEVVMFENWLRFYFIAEEGDTLLLRLPEKAMERLKENYGPLAGLAERLNNQEITHKSSLDAVCLFVASEIDGIALPKKVIAEVFDHPLFHLELQLFGTWVQNHEEQLDAGFMEFAKWQELFGEWKNTDDVKAHRAALAQASLRSVQESPSTTQ